MAGRDGTDSEIPVVPTLLDRLSDCGWTTTYAVLDKSYDAETIYTACESRGFSVHFLANPPSKLRQTDVDLAHLNAGQPASPPFPLVLVGADKHRRPERQELLESGLGVLACGILQFRCLNPGEAKPAMLVPSLAATLRDTHAWVSAHRHGHRFWAGTPVRTGRSPLIVSARRPRRSVDSAPFSTRCGC